MVLKSSSMPSNGKLLCVFDGSSGKLWHGACSDMFLEHSSKLII